MSQLMTIKVSQFFDRPKVIRSVGKGRIKVLRQTGGTVRKIARNSMKSGGKKGRVSAPGQPPRYHTSAPHRLKDGIFFGLDGGGKSVVIGIDATRNRGGSGENSVPAALERGGTVKARQDMRIAVRGPARRGAGGKFQSGAVRYRRIKKGQAIRYRSRPFITPAGEKFQDKYLALWKDAIG